MVKMRYLGPDWQTSMKLKRAFVDLQAEQRKCAPGGPAYARIGVLLDAIDAEHLHFFKTPAREPAEMHVCGVMQTAVKSKTPPA